MVAAISLTLQLQDIRVKQRRGTASQWQTFRIWHSRLHAASRNLEEQTETALMARLLTTLPYRLKLAPSSQCHPWLKSRSKCTHFTKATVKWDLWPGGCRGPVVWGRCCGTPLQSAFSPPSMFPFGCSSSLRSPAQGLRPGTHSVHLQNHADKIYSKACAKAFDVCGSETALSLQTWEKNFAFFPLRWER